MTTLIASRGGFNPLYAEGSVSSLGTAVAVIASVSFPTTQLFEGGSEVAQPGIITVFGNATFEGTVLGTNSYICQLGIGVDSSTAYTKSHSVSLANPSFSDDSISNLTVLYQGAVGSGTHNIFLLANVANPVTSGTISVSGELIVRFDWPAVLT